MRERSKKVEIREEGLFIEHHSENCQTQKCLFDEMRYLQMEMDLKNEKEKFRNWLRENSHYDNNDYSQLMGFDKIPYFLDIEIDYQYGLGNYIIDGQLPMRLKFDKKHQTTNGEVKEWVMSSLIQSLQNGELTEHPFHSIDLDFDLKKEKHLSLRIESKPLKTIQILYKKYSKKDNEFLKQFYLDNFLGDSELVTTEPIW